MLPAVLRFLSEKKGRSMIANRHIENLIQEYHDNLPVYNKLETVVRDFLQHVIDENRIVVAGIETRVKEEESLNNKLKLKGFKYQDVNDITDIVGARIITFYSDEVDVISALIEQSLEIDWENSVDKRKTMEIDRFGYMSLHYICRIPKSVYYDPNMPQLNEIRFELQMRSVLQHIWAFMYHDMGYKSDIEFPVEYQRNMSRLAGILELADVQFSHIRNDINGYRRNVQAMVASGNFDEVTLNGDTFRSYLKLDPFKHLVEKIAAINQAEIYEDDLDIYYPILLRMSMRTIGDVERLRKTYSDDAYQLTLIQLAGTDQSIVEQSVALQNICLAAILRQGFGEAGVVRFFAWLYGESEDNIARAHDICEQALKINLL